MSSSLLAADDLDEAAIADGEVLYMEGYLYDRDDAKEAFRRAAEVAHDHGRQGVADAVATRSASTATATTSGRSSRDEVDMLFGNEDELMSLYEVDDARRGDRGGARATARWPRSRAAREGCVVVTARRA